VRQKASRDVVAHHSVSDSQVNAEGIHQWPFDQRFPIDVVHHLLSGRFPFRTNRHDYVELAYVRSGRLVWQIQDRRVTQNRGDLFIMALPEYHRITEYSSDSACVESLFFHPELIRTAAAKGAGTEYLKPLRDSELPHIVPSSTGLPMEIRQLMNRIQSELPATSDRARLCVRTYVKMILVLLFNHYEANHKRLKAFDRRQRTLERFKALFDYLESNYAGPISPTEAARVVHMSPSHFRQAFKYITGQPFINYLNEFRIAKAQELLAHTESPIADVGLEVGFCDQSYFGLLFRKLTKMTPRQYRQKALEREKTSPLAATDR
jgi:AraC-like DNA-binding protein